MLISILLYVMGGHIYKMVFAGAGNTTPFQGIKTPYADALYPSKGGGFGGEVGIRKAPPKRGFINELLQKNQLVRSDTSGPIPSNPAIKSPQSYHYFQLSLRSLGYPDGTHVLHELSLPRGIHKER